MIKLLDESRISWFNYFYIFCMFIYAGSATVFARELGDLRTVGNAFGIIITVVFFWLNKVRPTRPYYVSLAVFLLYAVVTSINNKMVNLRWISEWIIWLTMAYGICQGFKDKLFVAVETVLYHLCIISVVCWIVHLLWPDQMMSIVKALEFSSPYAEDDNVEANMILYTINNIEIDAENEFGLVLRNAGFAWEPGAFASMTCLGLFCNMMRTNLKLRDNRSLWVLLVALLSSQSTTGFMILMVSLVFWLIINKKYLYLLLLVPVIVAVFNLPFVKDKLYEEIDNLQYFDARDYSGAIGRLYSLQLNFEEFLRHPIIGLGGYTEGTWLAQHGFDVATISGIGNMLVFFGAVMTALFLFLLIKACLLVQKVFDSPNAWILIVVMLGMMVSYNLWKQPVFIAFWMFGVYGYDYVAQKTTTKNNYSLPCSI